MTDSTESRSAIFARHVRRLRDENDWSQAELGRRVGLGQSRVAAIEATGSVTLDQADVFATVFGVPLETLLYEKPPPAKAVQAQWLLRIYDVVDRARDEVGVLAAAMLAEIPGQLGPPGTFITAGRRDMPPAETGSEPWAT